MKKKIAGIIAATLLMGAMSAQVYAVDLVVEDGLGKPVNGTGFFRDMETTVVEEKTMNTLNTEVSVPEVKDVVNAPDVVMPATTATPSTTPAPTIMPTTTPTPAPTKAPKVKTTTVTDPHNAFGTQVPAVNTKVGANRAAEIVGTPINGVTRQISIDPTGIAKLDGDTYIVQDGGDLWIVSGKFKAKLDVLIYSNDKNFGTEDVVYNHGETIIPILETIEYK